MSFLAGLAAPDFAASPRAVTEKVVYNFCSQNNCADGFDPVASLTNVKGMLYGTTETGGVNNGGVVFELDPSTGVETVVWSFCSQENCADGANPAAGLIDVNGTLYGTTEYGGSGNAEGTVFELVPDTGQCTSLTGWCETVLHSFQGPSESDGAYPRANLIRFGRELYGTTYGAPEYGGTCGVDGCGGTVFSVDLKTKNETVLYIFCQYSGNNNACPDGDGPAASLIDVNGTLYGTTQFGCDEYYGCDCPPDNSGCGVVFSLTTTGAETVLYSFDRNSKIDGAYPLAGLIDVNGTLYGTTVQGGNQGNQCSDGCGTVFSLSTTGVENWLYSFQGPTSDGEGPTAGLVNDNGTLYGTTSVGGINNGGPGNGIVFSVSLSGPETPLYFFGSKPNDGANPAAGLIKVGGKLYGTSQSGGTGCGGNGCGTVFEITP